MRRQAAEAASDGGAAANEAAAKRGYGIRALPPALRGYVALVVLASVVMLAAQLRLALSLPASGLPASGLPASGLPASGLPASGLLLRDIAIFALLAYLGERTTLRVNRSFLQSQSTAVHIAAILLFPPPYPALLSASAVLLTQAQTRYLPWYKRLFNTAHTTLVVGLSSAVFAHLAQPGAVLHPVTIVAAWPALALLLALYYALDVGVLLGVWTLQERKPPWQVWRQLAQHTLVPELAASTVGILAAVVWHYQPLLLPLFAVPVIALRVAFQAIAQAERRGEHLEAVLAVGQHLRLQQQPTDLLPPVAEAARAISGATAVAAYLRATDAPDRLERLALVPPDAAATGPVHLVAPRPGQGIAGDPHEGSLLVPLEHEGEVLGALRLLGLLPPLATDARDALAILATQAAIALQNAHLHERALAQAATDGLTGLLNHRTFQMRLEEEVARARRGHHPLAVLMVDLDDFGTINNIYGHQVGDGTLVAVAQALRQSVRGVDIAARYGGDEFAVILPDTEMDAALAIGARACAAIAALRAGTAGVTVPVAASIGVAALPIHAQTREELVRAADLAAYAAKHAGKGRVGRPEDAAVPLAHDTAVLGLQLEHANMATVEALAAAVDAKDPYTRGHSQRVSAYAVALARALGLSSAVVERVRLAGQLHDVGKIGVPDAILTKPEALTEAESAVVQQHAEAGERLLSAVPFLHEILPAVRHHHERWDGKGYPDGLAGAAIPAEAAILMVADSFDAMTSSRTYRSALPLEEAARRIQAGAGGQFDPDVVAAFIRARAEGSLQVQPQDGPGIEAHIADATTPGGAVPIGAVTTRPIHGPPPAPSS